MPDPTITISTPTAGSTVPRTFFPTGAYSPSTPTPTITVVLKDSAGNVVATGTNISIGAGLWSAQIAAPQAYNGATVEVSINGTPAGASVGNITVQ